MSLEDDPDNDVMDCSFLHAGCPVQLPPDAMEQHAQEAAQQHLALMSQTLVEEISRISNDVGALCQSLERLDGRMILIEEQIASLRLVQPGSVIVMHNCKIHFDYGKEWVSAPFSTHCTGYKLQFTVSAVDNTLTVRCRQLFFPMTQDDSSESQQGFLFRGEVAIELLNQLSDKVNHELKFNFSSNSQGGELEDEDGVEENEREDNLPLEHLDYNSKEECQYLKDDCLKFRVLVKSLT